MDDLNELNRELVGRFDKLYSDRTSVQTLWDAMEAFVCPYRGRFFNDQRSEHSIEWFKYSRVSFNSAPVKAHRTLSSGLHGLMTNPAVQWFDVRFRSKDLNKDKPAAKWIQDATEAVYYEFQDSNFNAQINEVYQDLAGFGTAPMTLEDAPGSDEQWQGLEFTSIPLKEAYFENDYMGRVLRFYRLLEWTPQEIISKFGMEGVPQTIKDMEEHGNNAKQQVLFVIYPKNNKIIRIGDIIADDERPWEYRYILKNGADTLGEPGGYYEMPAFVARWEKVNSSRWGFSPGMLALGDILSMNQARQIQLRASEKSIDPPILANERALITDLDLRAATISTVRDVQGIQPFLSGVNIEVSDYMIEQLENHIEDYFFGDVFSLPPVQAQPPTMYEWQMRREHAMKQMSSPLGRLQVEMLMPLVSRAFRMMARAGAIEQPPPVVIEQNAQFDIEFTGALTRSQRLDKANATERFMILGANIGEAYPEALDVIDADQSMRNIADDLNVPASSTRSEVEVQRLRDERQAKQDAAERALLEEQQGKAMEAAGKGQQALQGIA